jgi:hypothetical protein
MTPFWRSFWGVVWANLRGLVGLGSEPAEPDPYLTRSELQYFETRLPRGKRYDVLKAKLRRMQALREQEGDPSLEDERRATEARLRQPPIELPQEQTG